MSAWLASEPAIAGPAFLAQAVAVAADGDDLAVAQQPVEDRGGHYGVAEDGKRRDVGQDWQARQVAAVEAGPDRPEAARGGDRRQHPALRSDSRTGSTLHRACG